MAHNTFILRPTQVDDLPQLAAYWYDKMVLLQQSDPALRLMPDAAQRWQDAAMMRLRAPGELWLTAERDGVCLGGIIGRQIANVPGLLPETLGVIDDLIVDLHSPHARQGLGSALVRALCERWRAADVQQVRVEVAAAFAVEQAFWRGLGAQRRQDVFWLSC